MKKIESLNFIAKKQIVTVCFFVILSLFSSACASRTKNVLPTDLSYKELSKASENDPIEPINRFIFGFNMLVDDYAMEPIARGYRFVMPKPARKSIGNALNNLKSPVYLANNLMQGDVKGTGKTLTRFTINSTIGLAGLFDVASKLGFPLEKRDFGETLAVWGSGEGFYIVLPLLGPSNLRDTTGTVVDTAIDPLTWLANNSSDANAKTYGYIRTGLKAIDAREKMLDTMDEIKRGSVDLYAAVRTMYRQNRQKQISQNFDAIGKKEENKTMGYDFDFPMDE